MDAVALETTLEEPKRGRKPLFPVDPQPLHGVKHIYRELAVGGPVPDGAWEPMNMEGYLASFLNDGWKLEYIQSLGLQARIAGDRDTKVLSMLYVLVK